MAINLDYSTEFERKLEWGQIGESLIAKWLRHRGNAVLPVYEKEIDNGKGPRLFLPCDSTLVAPDLYCFTGNGALWVEAKRKSVFSWYRKKGRWTTGIDLRHYEDYLKVRQEVDTRVFLLFLHEESKPDIGSNGERCPVGLYGGDIDHLCQNESHRSDKWANGMVYWGEKTLNKYATLEAVYECAGY